MTRAHTLPARTTFFETRLSALAVHHIAFVVIAWIVIIAHPIVGNVSLSILALIAAPIILLLGVPHGAFDIALAHSRWPVGTRLRLSLFLTAYIAVAAIAGLAWWAAPGPALAVFLLISGYHFAGDWCPGKARAFERFTLGTALLTAPAIWHANEVISIFEWLAPASAAHGITSAMQLVAIAALPAAAVAITRDARRDPLRSIEIVSALTLSLVCHPILFFAIYFCCLHAPRHIIAVHAELKPANMIVFARASLPYAPLAILGILLGALLLTNVDVGANVLAAVFLGLAVLTAPHMLLIEMRAPKHNQI